MEYTDIFAKLSVQAEQKEKIARLYIGLTHLNNSNFESAAHEMELLKGSDYNDHWADYVNGEIALTDKNYPEAIKYFSAVIDRNPLFFAAYPKLIDALSSSGEFVKRDKVLKYILNELPAFPANLKMELDDLFDSFGDAQKADNSSPGTAAADAKSTEIDTIIDEIEQGQYEESGKKSEDNKSEFGSVMSEIYSSKSKESDQDAPDPGTKAKDTVDFELTSHKQEESLEEKTPLAESASPEVSKQTSRKRIVSKTLGEIYASQGQIDEAIAVFEKLLEQKPGNEEIIRKLSELKKL